jgi:hypothetical protein
MINTVIGETKKVQLQFFCASNFSPIFQIIIVVVVVVVSRAEKGVHLVPLER